MDQNTKKLLVLIGCLVAVLIVCIVVVGMIDGFWPWQAQNESATGESTTLEQSQSTQDSVETTQNTTGTGETTQETTQNTTGTGETTQETTQNTTGTGENSQETTKNTIGETTQETTQETIQETTQETTKETIQETTEVVDNTDNDTGDNQGDIEVPVTPGNNEPEIGVEEGEEIPEVTDPEDPEEGGQEENYTGDADGIIDFEDLLNAAGKK